ncbi:hypothetical protein ACA910_013215 [Epithemia clementina (nom. ined.)]
MAFPTLRVYRNRVYGSMNAWRHDQDEEGWRVGEVKMECETQQSQAPKHVRMISRLIFDVEALENLTRSDVLLERLLQPNAMGGQVRYIFADASGSGLGTSDWTPGAMDIELTYGSWGTQNASSTSSKFRELANIIFKIEKLERDGALRENVEFFVFTDNSHAESAFCRGTAKSPEVLRLMQQLHQILMKGRAFIHIIWISGRRMIDQGTDGLSRSDFTNGVMRGEPMLNFVPFHLSAMERQPTAIKTFVNNCFLTVTAKHFLTPKDWFTTPHDSDGIFVWLPPPYLGNVAVQQMAGAWHIRPWNTHLFLIPSLMGGGWRRTLYKIWQRVLAKSHQI